MMYLSVNGDQEKRGGLMRQFYQQALKEQFGTNGYPAVAPTSMATLEQLFDTPLTVAQVKDLLIDAFTTFYQQVFRWALTLGVKPMFHQMNGTHKLSV